MGTLNSAGQRKLGLLHAQCETSRASLGRSQADPELQLSIKGYTAAKGHCRG